MNDLLTKYHIVNEKSNIIKYSNYIKNGFTTSKVAVGKMLKQKGVVVANKKINGKSVNLYVGIRDLTETD